MRSIRSAAILVAALSPFFAAAPAGAQPPARNVVTQGPCNGNGGMEFVRCGYVNGARVCLIYCDTE